MSLIIHIPKDFNNTYILIDLFILIKLKMRLCLVFKVHVSVHHFKTFCIITGTQNFIGFWYMKKSMLRTSNHLGFFRLKYTIWNIIIKIYIYIYHFHHYTFIWKSLALSFDQKRLVVLRHFYIHLRFITYNVYTCPRQWAIKTAHKSVVYVQIIHLYSDVSSLTVANVCFFGLSVCDMSESTVI